CVDSGCTVGRGLTVKMTNTQLLERGGPGHRLPPRETPGSRKARHAWNLYPASVGVLRSPVSACSLGSPGGAGVTGCVLCPFFIIPPARVLGYAITAWPGLRNRRDRLRAAQLRVRPHRTPRAAQLLPARQGLLPTPLVNASV